MQLKYINEGYEHIQLSSYPSDSVIVNMAYIKLGKTLSFELAVYSKDGLLLRYILNPSYTDIEDLEATYDLVPNEIFKSIFLGIVACTNWKIKSLISIRNAISELDTNQKLKYLINQSRELGRVRIYNLIYEAMEGEF